MKPVGNYRWRIVALLFFATTINYIDRQAIGILKPYISGELGWSESNYGFIVAAFQIAYALGLLTTGRFIDKLGNRKGYSWAIIIWSIAAMAHAVARTVLGFAAVRFMLGMGQAANFPAAIKTVAEWFPKKERAYAIGLFNSGSNFGAIVAPVVISAITIAMGWKLAFVITGALGFIWVVFWLTTYQIPEKHPGLKADEYRYIVQDKDEIEAGPKIRWIELFRYKQTFVLCTTRFISDWVWWFFLFWIPDFLNKTFDVNLTEVVLPLIVIYTVSIIGGIWGGWLSSRLIQKGKSVDFARKSAILLCAFIVTPVILVYQVHELWISVALIALATAGHQGWSANMFALVSDIYPKSAVGSVVGLIGFAGAIGGALSATFIGLLLDSTGSYFLIFLSAASVYLINWALIKFFIVEIKPLNLKKPITT